MKAKSESQLALLFFFSLSILSFLLAQNAKAFYNRLSLSVIKQQPKKKFEEYGEQSWYYISSIFYGDT
jgi:hypothetical protein